MEQSNFRHLSTQNFILNKVYVYVCICIYIYDCVCVYECNWTGFAAALRSELQTLIGACRRTRRYIDHQCQYLLNQAVSIKPVSNS